MKNNIIIQSHLIFNYNEILLSKIMRGWRKYNKYFINIFSIDKEDLISKTNLFQHILKDEYMNQDMTFIKDLLKSEDITIDIEFNSIYSDIINNRKIVDAYKVSKIYIIDTHSDIMNFEFSIDDSKIKFLKEHTSDYKLIILDDINDIFEYIKNGDTNREYVILKRDNNQMSPELSLIIKNAESTFNYFELK